MNLDVYLPRRMWTDTSSGYYQVYVIFKFCICSFTGGNKTIFMHFSALITRVTVERQMSIIGTDQLSLFLWCRQKKVRMTNIDILDRALSTSINMLNCRLFHVSVGVSLFKK
jgi:hypothetical protein